MDITLNARVRKVGNSLAFFIPNGAVRQLGINSHDEIAATIKKRKNRKAIGRLFGAASGKKVGFVEGDRLDVRE